MNHCVSYLRFSTKGQIKGDSLERQLASARAYAKRHNLILDDISYRDLGVSAFRGKNATEGALKAFLDAVDDGTIPANVTLLVESFDRLSRSEVMVALKLFMSITERGVTVVTLIDEQVYNQKTISDNWTKLIISLAMMARAHEESQTKSVRVTSGIKASKEAGKKHGKCPMWMKKTADGMSFDIIEEKADIVRTIFRLRADGIGSSKISHYVNETYDMKWGTPQVVHALQNPSVIGTKLSQAGHEPMLNYYPAIIPKTLFYEVQMLMKSPSLGTRRGRRAEDEPNLFTGLVRCACCNSSMRFFRAGKNVSQRYLKCLTALNKAGCDAGFVNYDAFEREVIGWLLMDQDEEIVPLLEKKAPRKIALAGAEIQTLKEQQGRLLDLLAGGLMNTQGVVERLNSIELQIKDREKSLIEDVVDDGERLPAEKAWSLAVRHQDAELGDDKEAYYAVRREIRTAFQKAISYISIYPEVRVGDVHHGKFSVRFRGYDGDPLREYERPALTAIKGVWNMPADARG